MRDRFGVPTDSPMFDLIGACDEYDRENFFYALDLIADPSLLNPEPQPMIWIDEVGPGEAGTEIRRNDPARWQATGSETTIWKGIDEATAKEIFKQGLIGGKHFGLTFITSENL